MARTAWEKKNMGDYGCLPACWILDRTNCSSCTGQDLLCSLLQQQVQQHFPLMVYRLHLSKLRLALNGISTRTVKFGDQDAFGNRADSMGSGQALNDPNVWFTSPRPPVWCCLLPVGQQSGMVMLSVMTRKAYGHA